MATYTHTKTLLKLKSFSSQQYMFLPENFLSWSDMHCYTFALPLEILSCLLGGQHLL